MVMPLTVGARGSYISSRCLARTIWRINRQAAELRIGHISTLPHRSPGPIPNPVLLGKLIGESV